MAQRTHIGVMPYLNLSDEEEAVLAVELVQLVSRAKYPFSDRVRTLGAILNKLRSEPTLEPLSPELRVYEPPFQGALPQTPRLRRRGKANG